MATHPDYPYVSSFKDRHGVTRWRFRRNGQTISLKGQPGDSNFEDDYAAAISGKPRAKNNIVPLSVSVEPKSFADAWQKVKRTPEWLAHDEATKRKNSKLAEDFLTMPLVEGNPELWGDMPVSDMRRRHLKEIIARHSSTPHKAKHILVAIRKMLYVALDEEWIEFDPSHQLGYRPSYKGWRAWTEAEREAFEKRWPIGTPARTAYGLALWLGNRRSDIAKVKWTDFNFKNSTFYVEQKKGEKELILPITPMLLEILQPLKRETEFVLVNAYGKPFSEKSLTGMMAHWTKLAGMAEGCTLHGLRKTLGKLLAEAGSSTRQLMETLGHDDIAHAELYSREAEQVRLAKDGMAKLSKHMNSRRGKKNGG